MKKRSVWQSGIARYIICVSLGLWLIRLLHFVWLDWLTWFFLPLLWISGVIAALIGLIWAIYFWVRAIQKGSFLNQRWRRSFPLLLQLLGLVIGIIVPFEQFWLTANFYQNLASRQQVIALVQSNQIRGGMNNLAALPPAYHHTSISKEIQTQRGQNGLYILFFTARVFGGAQGFVYSEQAKLPDQNLFLGYRLRVERAINSYWYYVTIGD
ncbi:MULTISPECIES: hypothetical protein [Calothrix]|uniref:Uncharacterized protein n=2 Tax=Calothrix TaxID=1186 RepID=A0ABR8AKN1_9CYAN|nr:MULTISPECIES: hypothetical protein [Calothrix]MBD2199838.1 hypothetical protein [Calothrix parietina FACHB-288]MBD2228649.1 hypothetical protein [Calothrix anomala FACHB-343]